MKGIISAAAALSLAPPLAAYAGAAGQLPAGWEIVSSDGEKVFHNTRSGIAVSAKTIPSEGAPSGCGGGGREAEGLQREG